MRQKAVEQAWQQEMRLVRETGKGTRHWTEKQLAKLAKGKRIRRYEGHHIRDVSTHRKGWTGDPRNVMFVTRRQHLREHGNSFKNPTTGKLIDRERMMRANRIQTREEMR